MSSQTLPRPTVAVHSVSAVASRVDWGGGAYVGLQEGRTVASNRLGTRRKSLGRELADELRRRILAGDFPPGSKLPSEADIGAEYEVSRVTVRTALQALESRGLADIRHGSGTFVSNNADGIRAGLQELRSMTETIREMGHEPTMDRRALELRPATDREAAKLGIDVGDQVWSVERAVHVDGEPVAFSHDVIATAVLPAPTPDRSGTIDLTREQLGNGSVFAELEARGLLMVRSLAEILYSRTYFVEGKFQFVILRNPLIPDSSG